MLTFRLNKEEESLVGKVVAEKLNKATGPTEVIIPKRGFSSLDIEGGVFYDPESDLAFIKALRENLEPRIKFVEVDTHINDDLFAKKAADLLYELLCSSRDSI